MEATLKSLEHCDDTGELSAIYRLAVVGIQLEFKTSVITR